MFYRTRAAHPSAAAIGMALSLMLLTPAGMAPAAAAPTTAQRQNVRTFTDVATTHDFYREITWMGSTGISNGWSGRDGTRQYRPAQTVLRDQMAAFMYRAAGSPDYTAPAASPFIDISPSHPFYKEIAWLAQNNISGGWSTPRGKEFRPYQPVLRDQMAAFMYRLAGSPDYTAPTTSPFTDSGPGTTFYREIAWLAENGVSTGWSAAGGTRIYGPGRPVLRDQMAAFIYRLDAGGHLDHHAGREPSQKEPMEAAAVDATHRTTAVVKPDGTVWEWAPDQDGTLEPTQRAGITGATQVVAGAETTYALRSDGTVWGWGSNFYGQLANPDASNYETVPVHVGGLTDVVEIATTGRATFVVKSDGTVWSWGQNHDGLLGIGHRDSSIVLEQPQRILALEDIPIVSVEAGVQSVYAIAEDGTVWSWGYNTSGQLGLGHTDSTTAPELIPDLTRVKSVTAGANTAYAVKTDGTVWPMGQRNCDSDPNGNPSESTATAQQDTRLSAVESMEAGACFVYAVTTDGALWVTGTATNDAYLGTGTMSEPDFVRVPGLPAISSVTATMGPFYDIATAATYATATDGGLWGWGLLGPYHSRDDDELVPTPTRITH